MVKSQENHSPDTKGASSPSTLPTHLGFIVDGNRRWARERGLPTLEGHRRGLSRAEDIAEAVINAGVKYASFYLFSVENWHRDQSEVDYLMDLELKSVRRVAKRLQKNNVRCVILGSPDCPRPDVFDSLKKVEAETAHNDKGTVCFCFNYGGQQEIADAVSELLRERLGKATQSLSSSALSPSKLATYIPDATEKAARRADFPGLPAYDVPSEEGAREESDKSSLLCRITPDDLARHLYHPEIPPVDMIIRTSGEQRISGFMLWRAAYAEFMFIDRHFPELDTSVVDEILQEYSHRHRRFGK